ncbi:NADP-dependent oxidoreductase [Winogradskya humida]|uniref:NADPH:quinone reductase n=1 Tax=Winogradskya humida TaxID=113566 RepID=A0ABQ3ZMQ1_9ACTN|nr:NADP-dependent oxidoreductase [Actinoplanes humidus]GIE19828.1 NADPH:quinone reductase [Actinoplanes humidus]
MKAMRFHEFGGALQLDETERPVPADGQVLVRVAGTSFNPVDVAIRAGFLRDQMPVTLPHTPGIDLAGTTEDGRKVIAFLPMTENGAAAEWVTVPAELLADAPATIPLADAAAIPSAALTAWQAIHEHLAVKPGQRILINGAGGGVGGFAIQFAKQAGAHVLATASPRSRQSVSEAGADEIIDYTAQPLTAAITTPVDAILTLVRADDTTMAGLVTLVSPGGTVVSTQSPAPADPIRNITTSNMYVRSDATQLTAIAAAVDAGTLRIDISERHPLTDLPAIHDKAMTGAFRGKVIIEL